MPVRFHTRKRDDEPEINLVPFIDVLLVILIFLMLSTTFTRLSELQVSLPTAHAQPVSQRPHEVVVSVTSEGGYVVNRKPLEGKTVELLAAEMMAAAGQDKDSVVVISADAAVAHQSVINVMDAARRVGLNKLAFATRTGQDETPAEPASGN